MSVSQSAVIRHGCLHRTLCSIQYHTAVIQLLQPILHLNHTDPESHLKLVRVVVNHAKIGMELLRQHAAIYTNNFLSPIHLFCLVILSDALVRYDDHGDATGRTVEFCFTSLEEAKVGYSIAGPLQKMFRLSLTECRIPVSDKLERMIGASARMGPEELLEACTRSTYRQPIAQIMPNMEADLGPAFVNGWQHIADGRPPEMPLGESPVSGSQRKGKGIEIGSLLNM